MTNKSTKDSEISIAWVLLLPVFLAGLILQAGSDGVFTPGNEVVSVDSWGQKYCESQGYDYNGYNITERIPTIHCKTKTSYPKPLADGIIVLDK